MGIVKEGERVIDARNMNQYIEQFNAHLNQCKLLVDSMKALATKYPEDAAEITAIVSEKTKAIEDMAASLK